MVINGTEFDKHPLHFGENHEELCIENSDQYTYLGLPVTEDGQSSSAIKLHALKCEKHLNKFIIFLDRNQGNRFQYKKAVLDACFASSILYSGEAWLSGQLKQLEILYSRDIKCLL